MTVIVRRYEEQRRDRVIKKRYGILYVFFCDQ